MDLNDLLSTPLDSEDLDTVNCPEGNWKGELVSLTMDDEDRTDKNGNSYRFFRFICRPEEPQGDVDPDEAKAYLNAEGEDAIVSHSAFIRRKRDVKKVSNILENLGVPIKGRDLETVADEFAGGVPILMEVTHRESDDGDIFDEVASVAAANAADNV
ncbi:MAG TPA: hypothetical protein VKA19_06895 [Alphaproteobacteria bacterium]|nr:hypothetical protein [Alphaproteobacteria bacterium]